MSNQETFDAIVAQLRSMLAMNTTTQQAQRWMAEHHAGVPLKQRRALEKQARAEMLDAAGDGADWATACSVQRLADLYARALHIQDYKVCLAVEKELRAVRGELAAQRAAGNTTAAEGEDAAPDNVATMWPGVARG